MKQGPVTCLTIAGIFFQSKTCPCDWRTQRGRRCHTLHAGLYRGCSEGYRQERLAQRIGTPALRDRRGHPSYG